MNTKKLRSLKQITKFTVSFLALGPLLAPGLYADSAEYDSGYDADTEEKPKKRKRKTCGGSDDSSVEELENPQKPEKRRYDSAESLQKPEKRRYNDDQPNREQLYGSRSGRFGIKRRSGINRLDSNLEKLESELEEIRARANQNDSNLEEIRAGANQHSSNLEKNGSNLEELESDLEKHSSNHEKLGSEIEKLRSGIKQQGSNIQKRKPLKEQEEENKDPKRNLANIIPKHINLGEIVDRDDRGKLGENAIKTILQKRLGAKSLSLDIRKIEITHLGENQITIGPKSGDSYYHGTAYATFSRKNLDLSQIIKIDDLTNFDTSSANGALSDADIPNLKKKLEKLAPDLDIDKIKIEIQFYPMQINLTGANGYFFGKKTLRYKPKSVYLKNSLREIIRSKARSGCVLDVKSSNQNAPPSDKEFKEALKSAFPNLDVSKIRIERGSNYDPKKKSYSDFNAISVYPSYSDYDNPDSYFNFGSIYYIVKETTNESKQD